MPNVGLFVGPLQAYRAELREPTPVTRDASILVKVLASGMLMPTRLLVAAKPALVDQIDGPRRRSELPSTLSQLKQWKVRMGESDWGELADISVIGA
jgi:hypothetical protein